MAKRKSTPRKKRNSASSPDLFTALLEFWYRISPDRKLDALGILLTLFGGLTLLLDLTVEPGGFGAAWLDFWRQLLGWGLYVFLGGLVLLGVWLVLRRFERIPPLRARRLLGAALLFFTTLVWLQALSAAGGRLGAALTGWLANGLGEVGLWVAALAGLLIALSLTFEVSLFNLLEDALQAWQARQARRAERRAGGAAYADYAPELGYAPDPLEPLAAEEGIPEPLMGPPGGPAEPADEFAEAPDVLEDKGEQPVWVLPTLADMLDPGDKLSYNANLDTERAANIEETLRSFGAPARVVEIHRGPTITQFGVEPEFVETRGGRTRVRVGKIAALADDLALALAASRIRIQAPVPGKGYVGIEVPNEQVATVAMRDVMESDAFQRMSSPLRFALGQDVAGQAVAADLAGMPHLLVAGATGSGKSVCVNALICCLLLNNTPETLRLIMVDPKRVELTGYNGIPHLRFPVVVELDRVVGVLQWATAEMDKRYQAFAKIGARHIKDYNARMAEQGGEKLPYMVLVIDELADLMMVAPDQTERLLARMAQLARATGMHLILSTQRPSVDVVTGLIKANFPARIAFAVASSTDSRVILDQPGADRLLGRGDMLFQPPDAPAPVRLQGVYLAESEILRIVNHWRAFAGSAPASQTPQGAPQVSEAPVQGAPLKQIPIWEEIEQIQEEADQDPLFVEAVDLVRRRGRASISMLQRRMGIGYTRSARIIEQMEARGIIGPAKTGAQHREVLDYGQAAPPAGED
ncbi:MAG: DNA translocase FtsK [Anaerolineales bacterium]|nr:DNA translocase FtsK [Anaerolineales bacterium]MCW5855274.1 DNA translocase FtsK [Anaerolineales bacterium]